MGRYSNNHSFGFNLLVMWASFMVQYMPPNLQLIISITLFSAFTWGFIRDIKKGNLNAPVYVYILGFPVLFLLVVYFIGRNYLKWNIYIQLKMLSIMLISAICISVLNIIKKLKSGDIEEIRKAKLGIIFACIALILILYLIIDGVQKGIFTF
jgi:hypothetical protein